MMWSEVERGGEKRSSNFRRFVADCEMLDSLSSPMKNSNELRVFISSTFRDLQEEREHLVKKVFPEIRALCRERGVTFTEVDLRWGLTEENAMLGQVIRTCLEEVDRCRPFFIGMIGNRYGWVPEFHEIMIDPELLQKYPWIEEVTLEGASVTEMEFIHGVFNAPPEEREGEYAFFYHRADHTSERDDSERLAALIERARETGHSFKDFDSIEHLGEIVRHDMIAVINAYCPVEKVPSPLELERRAHAAFSASRTRAYIPNPLYLKEFSQWSTEGEKPLVVLGESGLGKSSLVAYLADYFRKKHRNAFIVEHYVGASDQSGSALAIMRHVIEEIRVHFSIEEKIPVSEDELKQSFAGWLFRAEQLATESDTTIFILLDALNQLGDYGRRLAWVPETIPKGIKLLLSTTPGETEERLLEREWNLLQVTPLEDERVRQGIVVRYLGEFKKGISPDQLRAITNDSQASSPLFLRVVAEELRLHGKHETINEQIERYTGKDNLLEIFDKVLSRIERDHGEEHVRLLLSLIALSRSGLSETEMLELTAMSRLDLSRLIFALDYHLIRRNGLLNFFHNYLMHAVVQRYLVGKGQEDECRALLLRFFRAQELTPRTTREVFWQLSQKGDRELITEYLSSIPVLKTLYTGDQIFPVQSTWSELVESGVDIEAEYRASTKRYLRDEPTGVQVYEGLDTVCQLLQSMSYHNTVTLMASEMIRVAEEMNDRRRVAKAEMIVVMVHEQQGSFDLAMEMIDRYTKVFEELGDLVNLASSHNHRGIIYIHCGEYDRALEYLEKALTTRQELGEKGNAATTTANIGAIYIIRGEYDRALEYCEKALTIHQGLADKSKVAEVVGTMGIVYYRRGDYDNALMCFERALSVHQELGERDMIAGTIGNIGSLYLRRGEHERARENFEKALAIHQELGAKSNAAVVLGSIGLLLRHQGNYRSALERYEKALTTYQEIGKKGGIAHVLTHVGIIHHHMHNYVRSLEYHEKALVIYRELKLRHEIAQNNYHISRTLLQLCRSHDEVPDSISSYLLELKGAEQAGDSDNWKEKALHFARTSAEESLQFAEEQNYDALLFAGKVLLARLDDAEEKKGMARTSIEILLDGTKTSEQQAECHYWLWVFDPSLEKHRSESQKLYSTLLKKAPEQEYRDRINELNQAADSE